MAENTATETDTKTLSAEEKGKMFDALPDAFKSHLSETAAEILDYNKSVEVIKAAEQKDPKALKHEIYEQNPENNEKLAVIRKQELKLQAQIESLRQQAYQVIDADGLMPKELSEDELNKLKATTQSRAKDLREKVKTFEAMQEMMSLQLTIHLPEITSRRGTSGGASKGAQTGSVKLRFKKLLVNGSDELDYDGKKLTTYGINPNGDTKYTFTFLLNNYLKKQSSVINWTVKDLQDAYLEGENKDSLPDEKTFTMTHTYKDEKGNEQSVNYEITAIR